MIIIIIHWKTKKKKKQHQKRTQGPRHGLDDVLRCSPQSLVEDGRERRGARELKLDAGLHDGGPGREGGDDHGLCGGVRGHARFLRGGSGFGG